MLNRKNEEVVMAERNHFEIQQLVDAFCDGKLQPGELAELRELLMNDAAARQVYLEQMWVEAELYWLCVSWDGDDACESCLPDTEFTSLLPVEMLQLSLDTPESRTFSDSPKKTDNGRWRSWLTIAAGILFFSAISGWLGFQAGNEDVRNALFGGPQNAGMEQVPREIVAQVTGTRDCHWGDSSSGVGFGSKLVAGQRLELRAGLAEVTFNNGASVLLEGPSEFVMPGEGSAKLIAGKMSAAIPQKAEDFQLYTSRLEIADSGTQFGLIVDPDGATELHVFEGPVRVRSLDGRERGFEPVELAANEAARLSAVSTIFVPVQSDDELFVRTLAPTAGPTEGLLAMEEFYYPVGPLSWQNGGFGWAGPWVDLDADPAIEGASSNAVGEGSLTTSALVSRGNRSLQTGQWNRVRRVLSTSLRGVFDAAGLVEDRDAVRMVGRDGTTVYLSFLQRVSAPNDVFYGLELNRGDGNVNRVLCIGNGAEGTGYGVSSNCNGTIDSEKNYGTDRVCIPLFQTLGSDDTETHFIVVRIEFGPQNQDVVTVYRDPTSLLDERKCVVSATLRGDFSFDRISLGNFNGVQKKTHEIDEIRLGTSFTAVTGRRAALASIDHVALNVRPQHQLLPFPGDTKFRILSSKDSTSILHAVILDRGLEGPVSRYSKEELAL